MVHQVSPAAEGDPAVLETPVEEVPEAGTTPTSRTHGRTRAVIHGPGPEETARLRLAVVLGAAGVRHLHPLLLPTPEARGKTVVGAIGRSR